VLALAAAGLAQLVGDEVEAERRRDLLAEMQARRAREEEEARLRQDGGGI